MQYDTGKHCVFYHRYHIVWSTKYRYTVLTGALRLRVPDICRQVCRENEVDILRGVLSSDHVHMFVSVPPKLAISDLVRKMRWSGCRPPKTASQCAKVVVLKATQRRGRRDDGYDDWSGSGKECFSGPWCPADR